MLTECGGISYRPSAGQPWFGYTVVKDKDAFLAKYKAEELREAIAKENLTKEQ